MRPWFRYLTFLLSFFLAPSAQAQIRAGGEVRVNTYTTGEQVFPSVASDTRGNFVVVWSDRSDGYKIHGQRFDRAGTRLGAVFRADSSGGRIPAVAMGADGGFLVVWAPLLSGLGIRGQLFDAAGNTRGAEFQIASVYASHVTIDPSVAADGRGNFVVVWRSTIDGSDTGIAGRRVSAQGAPTGAEFLVNTYTTGSQAFGDVSADAAGNFVVVWTSYVLNDFDVLAQRFAAGGTPLGANFVVNAYTTGPQGPARVAQAPGGSFVIAFAGHQGPGTDDIHAKEYDASGSPLGDVFQVNTYTTGFQGRPTVRSDGLGGFVVAWQDYDGSDGDGGGVKARRFFAGGTGRGPEFTVNTYTTGGQSVNFFVSGLGSDAAGNFVVTWLRLGPAPGSQADVYVQRYGGLHPEALVVDSAGNRVWEPGETVDVRPRWLNVNGAAQTIGGVMPGLFGPPGATYTITNGQAFYATIPNGVSAACTDCYSVAVNDAVPRPAAHWDTQAFEVLTPDTQGQVKSWTLHVGRSFSDVSSTGNFYPFVETLLHHGITGGCGGAAYCPGSSTTREQMSVFVLLAKEGAGYAPPVCTTPLFDDVPASSPFCRWIEELARRGVTGGCAPGLYCPSDAVSREQMAVFVLRTLDPALTPPACEPPNTFNDVPETSPFCPWIEELSRRGIVAGCGSGNYCPTAPVTREEMSVFLTGTFGLTLYGP